ncbi:hypothetical protein D3C87_1680170 [compost metagenome]
MVFRHQTLDVFNDKVNQRAFGGRKLIAHSGQDHVADLGLINHFFQSMGKVRDNNDSRRAAVVELVFQLTRGIQRVYVNDDHPRAQNTE